jgi:hypothetical protein
MRIALFAVLGLAGATLAQIPVPAFGSTFTSTLTRGYWFQAPVSFFITGLSVPNEALQPFQVVEVIDLGTTPPPAYPGTVTGTQLFYSNSSAGGSLISTAIPVIAGNYYGVLGACTSSIGSTTSYNSYAATAGPFASNILGIPTTLTRFGTQFGISAGGGQPCWSESAGQLSRVDVYASAGGGGTLATNTIVGAGCGTTYGSFHETFANAAAFDLSNTTLTWLNTGTGYTVLNAIPGTFVPPSPAATNLCAGLLDGQQTVTLSSPMPVLGGTTSTLQVCTKGYIATAPGNVIDFTPTAPELLAFPQTTWACWHDFNQTAAGSGLLLFEQVAGVAYVTWNGVYSYPTVATPSTVQFQFELATGNVTLVIGTFGNGSIDPVVVGFSPGGPSPNPGAVDISATPVIALITPESSGLSLTGASRPITGTNWNLNVTPVSPTVSIGLDLFGLADPGILDLGPLGFGQANCQLRSALDVLTAWLPAGTSHAYSLAIPNDPALVNLHVFTQSALLTLPSLAETITSNGIDGKIGNL